MYMTGQNYRRAMEQIELSPDQREHLVRAMLQEQPRRKRKRAPVRLLLAAALAWLFAESVLQARPIPALTKALRTALPLAVLAGVCYNFCVYFAAEPQLMGQNPALYENVSRLVQFWL